jgi:hypothetical protein
MPTTKSSKPKLTAYEKKRRADEAYRSLPPERRQEIREYMERVWRDWSCKENLGLASWQIPGADKEG